MQYAGFLVNRQSLPLQHIEAQNKAIEYLFQTVDDHCKRIEELEKKEDHVQNN